jgi:hypothetical protein
MMTDRTAHRDRARTPIYHPLLLQAALHGRVLIVEGLEKAERNVMPVVRGGNCPCAPAATGVAPTGTFPITPQRICAGHGP